MQQPKFIGSFDDSMLEDLEEFNKRYKDTWLYIQFKDNPKKELFYCNGVEGEVVKFSNEEMGTIILGYKTEADLFVAWPRSRLINLENVFLAVYRYPERQWKRAPCSKTVRMFNHLSSLFGKNAIFPWTEMEIRVALESESPNKSIIEVINSFKKSNIVSQAVTEKFGVSLPPYKEGRYLLWHQNTPVAWIDPKEHKIEVKYPYLLQEIKDFNRDHEGNLWNLN